MVFRLARQALEAAKRNFVIKSAALLPLSASVS
jgi:hypothetical protein